MPGHTRLHRRSATYDHRAAVPQDIVATYPKRDETFSLTTKNDQEALRRVRHAAVEVDRRFEDHRRGGGDRDSSGRSVGRAVEDAARHLLSTPAAKMPSPLKSNGQIIMVKVAAQTGHSATYFQLSHPTAPVECSIALPFHFCQPLNSFNPDFGIVSDFAFHGPVKLPFKRKIRNFDQFPVLNGYPCS